MKLKILLRFMLMVAFIIGCGNKKTLQMTEEDINTLDSLGYKVYPYKKDKQGNFYLDTLDNKYLDTIRNIRRTR